MNYARAAGIFSVFLLVALVSIGGLSYCPKPAAAQVNPSPEVMEEAEVRKFRKFLDTTSVDDIGKRNRARGILKRALRNVGGKALSRHLMTKGGLVGAAAGIWLHNGITLYTGLAGAPVLRADQQFSKSSGAPVSEIFNSDGEVIGTFTVVEAGLERDNGECRPVAEFVGTGSGFGYWGLYNSVEDRPYGCGGIFYQHASDGRGQNTPWRSFAGGEIQFFVRDSPAEAPKRYFGPVYGPSSDGGTFRPELYEVGAGSVETMPQEYEPPADDYVFQPEDTRELYDHITADPEYDTDDYPTEDDNPGVPGPGGIPDWARNLEEQHGPAEWSRVNPDGSETVRFRDGTEVTRYQDGTQHQRNPDGTHEWRNPDGSVTRYNPRTGEEVTEYPDGTTQRRQFPPNTQPQERGTPTEEQWTDPTGNPIQRPDENAYPTPNTQTPRSPGGTTNQGDSSCSAPRQSTFKLPEVDVDEKFPFSLILWTVDSLQLLASPSQSQAPCLDLPFGDASWCFTEMQGIVSMMRNLVWFFGSLFLVVGFYMLIKGGRGTD